MVGKSWDPETWSGNVWPDTPQGVGLRPPPGLQFAEGTTLLS